MHKILYLGAVLIGICLILTNSRTSLGGMVLVTGLYLAFHFRFFMLAVVLGLIALLFVALSVEFSWGLLPELMSMVSRSGDIAEVTSLTGRSHIWKQVLALIAEKPILGWGHGRIGDILYAHRQEIGFHVGQAHNIYLQILFSGGIIGLFFYVLSFMSALFPAVLQVLTRKGSAFALCLLTYFLLYGITETFMFSNVSNNAYLVFVLCMASLALFTSQERQAR